MTSYVKTYPDSTSVSVIYQRTYSSRDLYAFIMLFAVLTIGTIGLVVLMLGAPVFVSIVWGALFLGLSAFLALDIVKGTRSWVVVDHECLRWESAKNKGCLPINRIKEIHWHQAVRIEFVVEQEGRFVLGYPYTRHFEALMRSIVSVNPEVEVVRYSDGGNAFD